MILLATSEPIDLAIYEFLMELSLSQIFDIQILGGVIFGLKSIAWLDVWSIEHIVSGMSVGDLAKRTNHKVYSSKKGFHPEEITTRYFDVVFVLFIAYLWETIEHYLETGLVGMNVENWFAGVEFWGNRIITDPILMVLGYLIIKRYPKIVPYARGFSIIWLFVHIFIFPDSMYLHEVLL